MFEKLSFFLIPVIYCSNCIKKIIFFVFPFIENFVYKKTMTSKINTLEKKTSALDYMKDYKKLSWEELEKFHLQTLDTKKSFEDKAKTSLLSITIVISLIINFIDLVFKIQNFKLISVTLIMIALINLLLSGKMAFDILGDLNKFYMLFPSDLHQKKKIKKELLAYQTEKNVNYNILRNNHIYFSYKCIMISLLAISLIGLHYLLDKSFTKIEKKEEPTALYIQESNFYNSISCKQKDYKIKKEV